MAGDRLYAFTSQPGGGGVSCYLKRAVYYLLTFFYYVSWHSEVLRFVFDVSFFLSFFLFFFLSFFFLFSFSLPFCLTLCILGEFQVTCLPHGFEESVVIAERLQRHDQTSRLFWSRDVRPTDGYRKPESG